MKKILIFTILCLILAGCTTQPSETVAAETAAPETEPLQAVTEVPTEAPTQAPTRPLSGSLTWIGEGDPYEIPASLYRGENFSLYIPDDEWILTTPDNWVYAYNDQITFRIDTYEDMDLIGLRTLLTGQGYETDYDGSFTLVTQDNMLCTVTALEMDGHLCTFCTEFPNNTEYMEGAGNMLSTIRDSFLWELYD